MTTINPATAKKVIIVGGVAGGASCALNIPLPELRSRLGELPRDCEIHIICRSGQRAYYATRVLQHHGFTARTIAGGMLSHANLAAF